MFRLITLFERLLSLLIVFLLLTATVLWSGRIFGSEVGTLRAVTSGQAEIPVHLLKFES